MPFRFDDVPIQAVTTTCKSTSSPMPKPSACDRTMVFPSTGTSVTILSATRAVRMIL